jgi:hypothetical protein
MAYHVYLVENKDDIQNKEILGALSYLPFYEIFNEFIDSNTSGFRYFDGLNALEAANKLIEILDKAQMQLDYLSDEHKKALKLFTEQFIKACTKNPNLIVKVR